MALQKENRELRKDLDDVKKRLDTLSAKPAITKTNRTSRAKKPRRVE